MRATTAPRFVGLIVLGVSTLIGSSAAWSKDPVNSTLFGKTAIHGYDPVAYFTDGKPVSGKQDFEFDWMGAKWLFASAEHRDSFKSAPEKYAPQYGGYCAYGVAQGHAVDIDPNAWSIVGGKLYLNYDLDVQKKWKQDVPGFIVKADKNWPAVIK